MVASQSKAVVSKTKVHPRTKTVAQNRLPKVKPQKSATGVVCLGRLPKTFFEADIKTFFSQFGKVHRVRLSRSKKNASSKGYAYVEFEEAEVAKIAADAMNHYFIAGRAITAKLVEKEKLHAATFDGWNKKVVDHSRARVKHAAEKYAKTLADEQTVALRNERVIARLADLEIKYTLPTPL
jgi:nucleolar protein 15